MKIAATFSEKGLSFVYDGKMQTISKGHPAFAEIVLTYQQGRYEDMVRCINYRNALEDYLLRGKPPEEGFRIGEDRKTIYFEDIAFSSKVSEKALSMMSLGQRPEALYRFLFRTLQATDPVVRNDYLLFCDANQYLIDDTGATVGFKRVNPDYTDLHTGNVDNRPWKEGMSTDTQVIPTREAGVDSTITIEILCSECRKHRPECQCRKFFGVKVVSMPRERVTPSRHTTCSNGLHVGALPYMNVIGGGHTLLIRVCPEDVVAIPSDYNNQKMRCCRYEILGEVKEEKAKVYQAKEVITKSDWNPADVTTSIPLYQKKAEEPVAPEVSAQKYQQQIQANVGIGIQPMAETDELAGILQEACQKIERGEFNGQKPKSEFYQYLKSRGLELRASQKAKDLLVQAGYRDWISWCLL